MTRSVTPKDAASLILLRREAGELQVLLGRRAGKHRFLPDVYAFPGGRLDACDRYEKPFKSLNENIYSDSLNPKYQELLRALAVTGVRETWEETGIALGPVEAGRIRPDLSGLRYFCRAITPAESPIRFHARFFLQDLTGHEIALGGSGELLDLAFRPVEQALKLPLADITEFVLGQINGLGPDLVPKQTAFWRYRRGKPMIRWEDPA